MSSVVTDVTDEDAIERMCALAVERHGRLDIGVNSAGLGAYAPVVDQDTMTWDIVMAVNLRGVMLSMKHEARQMIACGNGGSIINLASLNAVQPAEGMGLYCATKAAVDMHASRGHGARPPRHQGELDRSRARRHAARRDC